MGLILLARARSEVLSPRWNVRAMMELEALLCPVEEDGDVSDEDVDNF